MKQRATSLATRAAAALAASLSLLLAACQSTQTNQPSTMGTGYPAKGTAPMPQVSQPQASQPQVSVAEVGEDGGRSIAPEVSVAGQEQSNIAGVGPAHIANDYYRRGRAGDTDAQYQLATLYLHGLQDVPKNRTLGKEWLKRAAASGHPSALYDLGFDELSSNPQAALDYFRRAGLQGNVDAQSTLGAMLSSGTQVAENAPAAFAWYSMAGDKANADLVAKRLNPAQQNVANNLLRNYESQVRVNLANAERRRAAFLKQSQ